MHGKWHDDFDVVPPRRGFQFSLYEEVLEEDFQEVSSSATNLWRERSGCFVFL